MNRYTIEHWRDGELLAKADIRDRITCREGVVCIEFPAGLIELATGDELFFDRDGLIEALCQPNMNEG